MILAASVATSTSEAADAIRFGTNWVAQPEHGGFYQALADGTYARYGLDVTIVPGGPQVNNRLLLPTGKIDFFMGGNLIQAFAAVDQNIPDGGRGRDVPEGAADPDDASRPGSRHASKT